MPRYSIAAKSRLAGIRAAMKKSLRMLKDKPSIQVTTEQLDDLTLVIATGPTLARREDGHSVADGCDALRRAINIELVAKRKTAMGQLDIVGFWLQSFVLLTEQIVELEAMRDAAKEGADADPIPAPDRGDALACEEDNDVGQGAATG